MQSCLSVTEQSHNRTLVESDLFFCDNDNAHESVSGWHRLSPRHRCHLLNFRFNHWPFLGVNQDKCISTYVSACRDIRQCLSSVGLGATEFYWKVADDFTDHPKRYFSKGSKKKIKDYRFLFIITRKTTQGVPAKATDSKHNKVGFLYWI